MTTPAAARPSRPAAAYTRREVIYDRPFGTALTMDVFRPTAGANGVGIVLAISEGWYSDRARIAKNIPLYVTPLVARGYTVFAVVHGSNPKFSLPENIAHLYRAVRFIRYHARQYRIAADRIGGTGDSAGGHLALMLGGAAPGPDSAAADPVDRESSRIQAVVAFYPPTDFLNWGAPGRRMLGQHPLVPLAGAFAFTRFDSATQAFRPITDPRQREAIGRAVSPITYVGPTHAPTLVVVGDHDHYIPPQQSERLFAQLQRAGVPSRLVIVPGGDHDEGPIQRHIADAGAWFDRYLLPEPPQAAH